MESVNFFQVVPNSSFTIGDLVEAEFKTNDGGWERIKGRITNSWDNQMMFSQIIEGVDDEGKPWVDSHVSYYLWGDKKIEIRNTKVLEKGPWHKLICGED
jgi:hypothetical protein